MEVVKPVTMRETSADPGAGISPGDRAGEGWRSGWLFLAVMLLAGALRFHNIDANDVWVDEANSILTAKQPWSVILDMLKRDSSPPLYYFLLQMWMGIAGDGPTALRLPSTLFSLLLVASVYSIGVRECSRRVGLWAAFLVAISPAQVFYSQQTRMYTLLPLLALAAWWLLVRYLRDGRARDFWLSMLVTAAALYTHNFAVYVPLVHAVLVLGSGRFRRHFPMWILAAAFLLIVYAPWVPTLLTQLENTDHYAWYVMRWEKDGFLGAAMNTLRSYGPAGSMVMSVPAGTVQWHGVPAIIAAGFAVWGTIAIVRRRRDTARVSALWLPVACVVPIAASLFVSSILTPHYVPGRVDQMMFPCFALLAAVGISALKPVGLQWAIAPAFLAVAIIGREALHTDYREYGLDGAEAALVEAILAELRPGDVILCTSLTRAPLEYYLQRASVDVPILSYPRTTARHMGSQNHRRLWADKPGLLKEAGVVLDRARTLAKPGGRMILLRTSVNVNGFLEREQLQRRFGVRQEDALGRFKLTGTKEFVWLTVNHLDGSGADAAAPTISRKSRQLATGGAQGS
jgi:4-amino-4-deoxy-L-arabinose transferase-like glycosyltransferase